MKRHEDVHGVSGEGDKIADVFEASDGTTVIVWLGPDGSTQSYRGAKNATNVHGHGGKTEIEWYWEQDADPDPMDAVFAKKIAEAGGSTASTGATGAVDEAKRDAEADAIAEQIIEEVELVKDKVVEKLAVKKVTEKVQNGKTPTI